MYLFFQLNNPLCVVNRITNFSLTHRDIFFFGLRSNVFLSHFLFFPFIFFSFTFRTKSLWRIICLMNLSFSISIPFQLIVRAFVSQFNTSQFDLFSVKFTFVIFHNFHISITSIFLVLNFCMHPRLNVI